ncbi:MAG: thiol reductant ABC exporter subunit CydC [Thiohalocapsa sp.]|jgi:ATP-binding cassette subfamily C protein CydC|uniref:thiol reductant ABC exporter subunit CydC n=1 Tax=Thiohalocapsa sp. TaxID=2497641 RepID=UPI0025DB3739|nr:thiol reductant ABC exporter subunit CydC [Thiohalocapsa sp.]MCG6940091.1 thiol reductant ABC exporter subunit CydC [Thiohalocapsa sp.]
MTELLRLWHLFRPYRGWMLGGFLIALVTLLANVTLLAISGWFITAMAVTGAAGVAMNYFTPAAIIRASAIARTAGRYFERLVNHDATLRQLAGLRVWFYRHLEPLAPARLQQYHSADLLSRIRADVDALDHFYTRVLVPVLVAAAAGIGFFMFAALFHVGLALLLLAMLLVAGVAMPWLTRRLGVEPGRRLVETQAELRRLAIDGTQGLSELLAYGAADAHAARLDAVSHEVVDRQLAMSRIEGLSAAAVGLCANLALFGVLLFGIPLAREGTLPPPQLAMLALFALATFEAVAPLPLAFQHLELTLTAARRLFAVVDAEPAVTDPPGPSPRPTRNDIAVRALRFGYPGAARPALDRLDLDVPEGSRTAIVGATGSGKTTLFNLLLRFWAPDAGEISLGGAPLAAFRGEDLRERIALVSQHTHLFDASIRENLLLAAPNAPQGKLEQACRTAQIHDFIAALPDGYDTWAGETGVRLSGGQGRRIAIARALLRDAPILLLDEPTEGLDAGTERALMDALRVLMAGRTVLMITHRPAALADMDRILVLHEGRVVEQGTHAELLGAEHYPRLLGLDAMLAEVDA